MMTRRGLFGMLLGMPLAGMVKSAPAITSGFCQWGVLPPTTYTMTLSVGETWIADGDYIYIRNVDFPELSGPVAERQTRPYTTGYSPGLNPGGPTNASPCSSTAEHGFRKAEVAGSSPVGGSID